MANTVSLSIEPEGKTISGIPWSQGMNVQTAMELAYGIPPGLSFALQYYGANLGYLVLMVDGTSDAAPTYWFLYVNGVLSQTGIDGAFLNSGDAIALVYEQYTTQKHPGEIHRVRHDVAEKAASG